MPSEAFQVVQSIDIVECISMVCLTERPGLPALLEQSGHEFRDGTLAVRAHERQKEAKKLLAEGVSHLKRGIQNRFIVSSLAAEVLFADSPNDKWKL